MLGAKYVERKFERIAKMQEFAYWIWWILYFRNPNLRTQSPSPASIFFSSERPKTPRTSFIWPQFNCDSMTQQLRRKPLSDLDPIEEVEDEEMEALYDAQRIPSPLESDPIEDVMDCDDDNNNERRPSTHQIDQPTEHVVACFVASTGRITMKSPSGYDQHVPIQFGCYGISCSDKLTAKDALEQTFKFSSSNRTIRVITEKEFGGNLNCAPLSSLLVAFIALLKQVETSKLATIFTDSALFINSLSKLLESDNKNDVYWSNIYKNEYVDLFASVLTLLHKRRTIHDYGPHTGCRSINEFPMSFGIRLIDVSAPAERKKAAATMRKAATFAPPSSSSSSETIATMSSAGPFIRTEMANMHKTVTGCITSAKAQLCQQLFNHLSVQK